MTLPGHKEDVVFYTKVAYVLRERLGVLRPGREWFSHKLDCPPAGLAADPDPLTPSEGCEGPRTAGARPGRAESGRALTGRGTLPSVGAW